MNAFEFLISTLFSIYILAVMLRFLLQLVRADFYNPISQAIVKVTNPPLRPLRRLIPGFGRTDVAAIVLMFALQLMSLFLIGQLRGGIGLAPLLLLSVVELINLAFMVFIWGIIIQALLSWVNPGTYNPVSSLLHSLTDPLLRPVRRHLPPVAGTLDLSPLVAILGLEFLRRLLLSLFF